MTVRKYFLYFCWIIATCLLGCSSYKGILTDARDHHNTVVLGKAHEFAAFSAMSANLPLGLSKNKKSFIYLSIIPNQLAPFASEEVKVEGEKVPHTKIIVPNKIWVKADHNWKLVYHKD